MLLINLVDIRIINLKKHGQKRDGQESKHGQTRDGLKSKHAHSLICADKGWAEKQAWLENEYKLIRIFIKKLVGEDWRGRCQFGMIAMSMFCKIVYLIDILAAFCRITKIFFS